jgi:hypothetical protein
MASADFCPVTATVTDGRVFLDKTHVEQISSDSFQCPLEGYKNVNCRYTTAACTLSPEYRGLRHVVLTCPVTRPYMPLLFVGS